MELELRCNVGGNERTARLAGGIAAGVLAATLPLPGVLRWIMAVAAGVSIATGATQYCPLNQALGRNSCRRKKVLRFAA